MDIAKRFNRIVAIYFQLQAKSVVKAQELAEHFEVSLRTIYRDIKALEQAGIPIYGEAGTGYTLMEGYRLPPTRFSSEEILSLATAEKLMQKFVDADLYRNFSSAISKIRAYLRYSDKEHISILENNMLMSSMSQAFNKQAPAALTILFEGITKQKIVMLTYQSNAYEQPSVREIEPIGAFHQANYWYFMTYCHLRKDYRQFRIDRIKKIQLTDRSFTRNHRELSYYLPKKEDIPTTRIRIAVPIAFAQYMHWERRYYGFEEEEIKDNFAIMTFNSRNMEEEFARWYLMFADQSIILEPPALKKRVRELVKCISID